MPKLVKSKPKKMISKSRFYLIVLALLIVPFIVFSLDTNLHNIPKLAYDRTNPRIVPVIRIVEPFDTRDLKNVVPIRLDIQSVRPVTSVEILIDGTKVKGCGDINCPYDWDTRNYSNGRHSIYVTAINNKKYSGYAYIDVSVSNTPAIETKIEMVDPPFEGSKISLDYKFDWNFSREPTEVYAYLGVAPDDLQYFRGVLGRKTEVTVKNSDLTKPIPDGQPFYFTIWAKFSTYGLPDTWEHKSFKYIYSNSPVPDPRKSLCAADVNNDKTINIIDITLQSKLYNKIVASYAKGDINGDGIINVSDTSWYNTSGKLNYTIPNSIICN